eukprot:scaffold135708_cov33-Tisochrysis_lutea.AAC.3
MAPSSCIHPGGVHSMSPLYRRRASWRTTLHGSIPSIPSWNTFTASLLDVYMPYANTSGQAIANMPHAAVVAVEVTRAPAEAIP